jgi:hypothetical protein
MVIGPPNPDWEFQWASAPKGDSWPVRMFFLGPVPPPSALATLSDLAQQAHDEDALEAVVRAWATYNELTVHRYVSGADHAFPFGAVSVSTR